MNSFPQHLTRTQKKIKFLLLKSRAEGKLGRYRAALDTLGIIDSINCDLSPIEKFHFESIENHCNWQLGEISTEQFLTKLQELSTNDLVKDSVLVRFNFLRFSLMYGNEFEVNTSDLFERIKKLKEVAEEILLDSNFSQEIKVNVEFSILENELKWLVLEDTLLKGESAIYEETKVYVPEHWDRKENFPIELERWGNKSNELLQKAQNITTKADISCLQIRLWFHLNQFNQFWAINSGKDYFISEEVAEYFINKLQNVINIYIEYQQNYSIIRAKMIMVEMLSFIGKLEESETLRKQINNQANKMSYEALKHLTEFSLHKNLLEYAQNIKLEQDN